MASQEQKRSQIGCDKLSPLDANGEITRVKRATTYSIDRDLTMTGFLHADDAFLDLDWDYIRIYEIEIALDRESIRLSTTISNEAALTIKADQCIREQLKEVALQCSELLKELGQSADYQI